MKKIKIVGLGPGNIDYITKKGIDIIGSCEVAIGSNRQLEDVASLLKKDCEKYILGKLSELILYLKENREKEVCIIVSGDTGFYSLLGYLGKNFSKDELEVVPGISSYQYLFSQIKEMWHNYKLASVHGRELDYIEALKKEEGLVLLTDSINSPYTIAKNLYEADFRNVEMVIGEKLSYFDEKITTFDIENYEKIEKNLSMNVVVVRKKS